MNRNLGTRSLRRLLALPLVVALLFTSVIGAAPVQAASFGPADADAAIRAFNAKFWDPQAKYFWADSNRGDNYQSFWVEAELWEMVMDAYLHTSDPELKAQLRTQIDDIFDGTVAKYGEDWTNNPFNDDIMWWAMGSARAYQITGEARYLERAQYYFDFVYDTQWDDEFAGGGIWWLNSEHDTKNACINFPAAQTAVFLYELTGAPHYLEAATRIYRWSKTMLTDGEGKVFDRIEVARGPIPDSTHYNQGTFVGSAVGLYRVTGDETYLEDAVKGARFTMDRLVDNNRLLNYEGPNGDLKGGKTILIRNLAYLQQALDHEGSGLYDEFEREFDAWLAFNTAMAWSHRNEEGIVDGNWVGQLRSGTYESWSSSGAVQALTVVEPQEVTLRYPARSAYDKIEAERYNIGKGFVLEGSAEGTLQLGGIQAGHFAAYKNVDFGSDGATGFIARAASGTSGGNIEVRLDALDGPLVGNVRVEGTGGWHHFIDAVAVLKDEQGNPVTVTGTHDVYLVFTEADDEYLFNLNWLRFTKTDPTQTHAYAKLRADGLDGSSGLSVNAEHGYLEGIADGAHALYRGIDFGSDSGAAGVTMRVASGHQGGTIEVKLDRLDGPSVGVVQVPALGDWDQWVELMAVIDHEQAVGIHDVYLVFHGTNGQNFPCNLDWFSFTTVKGSARDAFGKLEAEHYTIGDGFGTEQGGGQTYLAGMYGPNQPYAMYNYIDFGDTSPEQFHVHAASDTSGGTIEVRLDSPNGPLMATATVNGTGGWQNFQVFSADVTTPVTGKHIVFLIFKGSDWLYNLDKFTFGDPDVFTAPTAPPEPVTDEVPPGEVENVRAVRENGHIRLYWDGPYDLDGKLVQIRLLKNKKQVGETLEIRRGIQTALLPEVKNPRNHTITFTAVDHSGNVSKGYTVRLDNLIGK
ncbi:carbohydrate-binding protein [Paenibacillus campinasensis]|uniref:Carbohydrate-binding protein n=1 Tax=Paenibacillus campinasensis TaxID=66347 RepID=A0ABW9T1W5_9BACL|nr:carbohydrate-binding protein [Paenibacillus campinasensis]MUG65241.1 carbohydrate-binding protein [Paenibacillus campinasensis]